MQKLLFLALIAVFIVFHMQAKYGKGGYIDDNKARAEIALDTKRNTLLKERNDNMILKIAGLKGSDDSLEARSRSELNWVKQGETLVLLPGNEINLNPKQKPALVAKPKPKK